jgi:hypothetical protein
MLIEADFSGVLLDEMSINCIPLGIAWSPHRCAVAAPLSYPMSTQTSHESSSRFSTSLHLRMPASMPSVIGKAAEKNLMTSSEYIRRSVIERLKADGFDPTQMAGAA